MSIDLAWDKLDAALSSKLVDILNDLLTRTERPSFIGPVEVTSLSFGTVKPDVEIIDMWDIYKDFLEDSDEEEERKQNAPPPQDEHAHGGYEWVPYRSSPRTTVSEGLAHPHHLPPHARRVRVPSAELFASAPGFYPRREWDHTPEPPKDPVAKTEPGPTTTPGNDLGKDEVPIEKEQAAGDRHPNLQLQLRVLHHSDLRLTFTTSLLINYPSAMFMSLPIKLSVTGLVFNGEVVVAYEGERRRIHFCIVDDLDPGGPFGERLKRDTQSATGTPPDAEYSTRLSKPLPIGQRLLPSICIESELGQADKHVLKNVSRVEKFVQDFIRKTVEDELVFPNFQTVVLNG